MNNQKDQDIQKKSGYSKLIKSWIDYFDKKLGNKDRRVNEIRKIVYLIGFIATVGIALVLLFGLIPKFNYNDIIIFLIFIVGLILLIQLTGLLFTKNPLTKLFSGIIYLLIFTFLILLAEPGLFEKYKSMFNFNNTDELKVRGTIYLNGKLISGITVIPLNSQVPTATNSNGIFEISIPKQELNDAINFRVIFEALNLDTVISKRIERDVRISILDFNIKKELRTKRNDNSNILTTNGTEEYILAGRVITQVANRTEPLKEVLVKTIDGSIKDITDNDGNFKLKIRNKRNSIVNLIFYKSGYSEKNFYYKLPKTDIEVKLNKENP